MPLNEEYTVLYQLPDDIYMNQSPILIHTAALVRENATCKRYMRFELRSMAARGITSCTVNIVLYDITEAALGKIQTYTYKKLQILPGESFGLDTLILLEDVRAARATVWVSEVIFYNRQKWETTQDLWQPMPIRQRIEDYLGFEEITARYRDRVGGNCIYAPDKSRGLFRCTCGNIQPDTNPVCVFCGRDYDFLHDSLSLERLATEDWLKRDMEKMSKKELRRGKKRKRKDPLNTRTKIGAAVFAFIVILTVIFFLWMGKTDPEEDAFLKEDSVSVCAIDAENESSAAVCKTDAGMYLIPAAGEEGLI